MHCDHPVPVGRHREDLNEPRRAVTSWWPAIVDREGIVQQQTGSGYLKRVRLCGVKGSPRSIKGLVPD